MKRTAACLACLALWGASLAPGVLPSVRAQQSDVASPRASAPLTILQLNDVYSTVPIDGAGGLARVATLKRRVAADGRTPLLVMAGDFLSSSVASSVFKGEQMIAALNAAGLDLATLGNHEFDFGVDLLLERMAEARWQWVVSNVVDLGTGQPIGGASPFVVRTFGTLRVGFLGLCVTAEGITRDTLERVRIVPPLEAAAAYLPALRREKVDVIVALTHLTFDEDRALAERFPEIDLIVGGHEHFPITATVGRTLISKAGTEARAVARIDVDRRSGGEVERFFELIPIGAWLEDHPETAAVVASYEAKLGAGLDATVASTRVPLDAVTAQIRSGETNLGNLVADAVRAAAVAEVAIVNAGGIRGDRVFPPGPLTRRALLEIHPFGNVICTLAVTGRVLLDALNHGVSRLPDAAGQFPQVSGLTLQVDGRAPPGQRVREVRVNGVPLDLDRTYTLAVPDFIFRGGDEYAMLGGGRVLVGPESGRPLVLALEAFVSGRDVAPAVEGRIVVAQ